MTDIAENLEKRFDVDLERDNSLIDECNAEKLLTENSDIFTNSNFCISDESKLLDIDISENHIEETEKNEIHEEINPLNSEIENEKDNKAELSVPQSINSIHVDSEVSKPVLENNNDKKTVNALICEICSKKVYPMEKVVLDLKIYHKDCFRCCKCKKALSVTVVTKFNDYLFCKHHYIEMFRMRGKYDDINIDKCQPDAANSFYSSDILISNSNASPTKNYTSNNNTSDDNKTTAVNAKDLAKRYQDAQDSVPSSIKRKDPIDIGIQRKGSVTQAWVDRQREIQLAKSNSNNSNNIIESNDFNQNPSGLVKNRRALFESKN